jgi:hypothetical protein
LFQVEREEHLIKLAQQVGLEIRVILLMGVMGVVPLQHQQMQVEQDNLKQDFPGAEEHQMELT